MELEAVQSQNEWKYNSSPTYAMICTGISLFINFWSLTVIQINYNALKTELHLNALQH